MTPLTFAQVLLSEVLDIGRRSFYRVTGCKLTSLEFRRDPQSDAILVSMRIEAPEAFEAKP